MIQFDEHIFQLGWFNHQLVVVNWSINTMIFDAGWTNSLKAAHLGVVNLPIKKKSDPVFWNQQWTSPSLIDDAEIIATKKLEIPMPQFPPWKSKSTIKKKTAMGNFAESTICVFSSSKVWGLLLFYESA